MNIVSLDDVVDFYSGGTPSKAEPEFWSGDIPWFSAKDMKKARLEDSTDHISEVVFSTTPLRKIPAGTVALVVRGMILAHTVPISILDVDCAINQDLKALIPRQEIDGPYLAAMLRVQHGAILRRVSTAAHGTKKLESRVLQKIKIPLPSIGEQRRVARILDQADAIRTKRQQILAHLDTLPQSIFHDMFGDPASNERGWELRRLGDIALKFSDGPFGSNLKSSHYAPSGVRVIRLQNIGVGKFVDDNAVYVTPEHFASVAKHRCLPGDVLIGTLGDPNLRACVQPEGVNEALNKADCVQMRIDPQLAHEAWACWLLNMPGTLAMATVMLHGQTRTRIAMGQLRELKVPVPPISLQRDFASVVENVNARRIVVQRALAADDELFASLQACAFKGEL